jgi:heat shock protein HslJ
MTDRGITIIAVLVVAWALVAGGCASQGGTGAASGAEPRPLTSPQVRVFQGEEWRLTRMVEHGDEVPLVAKSAVTLLFVAPDRVGGAASVNRYSGGFDLGTDGRLTWKGDFATTRMAGLPELMTQESRYVHLLGRTNRARIDGLRLILDDGSPSTMLEFSLGK